MADAEEKARQEKIAAAKKRVELLKKRKLAQKAAEAAESNNEASRDATPAAATPWSPPAPAPAPLPAPAPVAAAVAPPANNFVSSAFDSDSAIDTSAAFGPSLAEQSRLRSTSFRTGSGSGPTSPGPLSPDGDTAPDIYRKHVARIEDLERENKRLAKESGDAEKRWRKAEDELADLREAESAEKKAPGSDQVDQLIEEVASLQRQNAQLQQQISRGSGHAQRPSFSASPPSTLQAELDSKSATIESMEIELSNLRARVDRQENGVSSEKEQITALEQKVGRAESAAGQAQRELQDVKKNLEHATEKAVREGGERSSAETKLKALEEELRSAKQQNTELTQKVDGLEKKITTLTTLHKEQDTRSQSIRREKETAERETMELRTKLERLQSESLKTQSRKSIEVGGGLDDEDMDELENEEREKMEKHIRSLEEENHDLRSGAWIQRRREMENSDFQDVDLFADNHFSAPQKKNSTGGIGDFFTNGLNALTGTNASEEKPQQPKPQEQHHHREPERQDDGLLDDGLLDDDDMEFDEDAFRRAHEDEAKKRLERIRELKRSLQHWEGWRLDLVDIRRGNPDGIGDIFEV